MSAKYFILSILISIFVSCKHNTLDQLATSFKDPPDSTKPWVYWYWIDENIAEEGIRLDLEAMARAGIGQALIGHVSPGEQRGEVRILSEKWWDMIEYAVEEGQRLGVDIGFFNGPGWSQSGGPWISNDQAMRHIVSREVKLSGPSSFKGNLTFPDTLFEQIALQAIPIKTTISPQSAPNVKSIHTLPLIAEAENLLDRDPSTHFYFPETLYSGDPLIIDIQFVQPAAIRTIQFDFLPVSFIVNVEIQVRKDNNEFQNLRTFSLDRRYINFEIGPMRYHPTVFSLPDTQSDLVRIKLSDLNASPGAGFREIILDVSAGVDQVIEKQLGKLYSGPLPGWNAYLWPHQPEPPAEFIVDPSAVIDLSAQVDEEGYIEWEVPEDDWVLLQTGMVPTGATNVPVPAEATGYECDKFTKEAIETHFGAFIGKFLKKVPESRRKALKTIVIDSYEVGPQNWTTEFKDIFMERYGYDPIPWLPVFNGWIIGSADLSDRFLWDLRRLSADLISNVYVNRLRELSNENGLDLWLENYGHWGFPAEFLQYGGQADKVSGEFWYENPLWDLGPLECRAASSAAHIYGKRQVFAEAFTAGFNFRQYPAIMKSRGDQMFCEGINHFVQHVYIHQPWENRRPGVTAWFGMSYQRHNTWFEQSKAWNEYLKRCHYLLQQGLPISDICYFLGEDAPKMTGLLDPELPTGYDYDFINADVILKRLTIKKGLLTLPDGKTYQLMILPPLETMRPQILKKVRELLLAGANIYGPPPSRSPSMENYPTADVEVRTLAQELWGEMERDSVKYVKIGAGTNTKADTNPGAGFNEGRGYLFCGSSLEETFETLGITPDVIVQDTTIRWTHRRTEQEDIYFISNQEGHPKALEMSFRISGKIPEFWYPEDGIIEKSALFRQENERTKVPIMLDAFGSVFVVFRETVNQPFVTTIYRDNKDVLSAFPSTAVPVISYLDDGIMRLSTTVSGNYTLVLTDGKKIEIPVADIPAPCNIDGSWSVSFPESWDAPVDTTFDQLISWTDHKHTGIRHFSGTAVYQKKIKIPEAMVRSDQQLVLDLGEVMVIAEVVVNGQNMGIFWKNPYKVDITEAAQKGDNDVEIRVTNTWWNRLVGDEKYPEGFPGSTIKQRRTFTTAKAWNADDPLMKSGLIGPIRIYIEKQYRVTR